MIFSRKFNFFISGPTLEGKVKKCKRPTIRYDENPPPPIREFRYGKTCEIFPKGGQCQEKSDRISNLHFGKFQTFEEMWGFKYWHLFQVDNGDMGWAAIWIIDIKRNLGLTN